MKEPVRHHNWHVARRTAQILAACAWTPALFLREQWRIRGQESATLRALGRVLVRTSTRLGATFIKVGQIASTRGDILPAALTRELAALQDQVPAFAFSDVRKTIESELGAPLETFYSAFEREPVAAASVAQVHRAVWRATGQTVAVKVRRPDIVEKVRLDRSVLLAMARWFERIIPSLRLISFEAAMENFCDAVEQQIHLTNEARHNRRFAANFADDPELHFPDLVPEGCTDAILTMEFIEGVREPDLVASGGDALSIAKAGLRCVCRMVFSHGFVHADLHPGNIRFFPPRRVVLLDLGLVGELTDEDRLMTARTLLAFANGDGPTVARLFYENAAHRNVPDYPTYEKEMCELVRTLINKELGNTEVTLEIGRIFDLLRRHRIQARGHMTMINLALMTAEGLGKRLAPELNLTEEAVPYLMEALGITPRNGTA